MECFDLGQLLTEHRQLQRLYLEFLRVPALSAGLYVLPAGAEDPQQPHTEDEVYLVVQGRGFLRVGESDQPVQVGSLIFVKAKEMHRFHTITEELTMLVFFAPAESTIAN